MPAGTNENKPILKFMLQTSKNRKS